MNLTALPARLMMACRRRLPSLRMVSGISPGYSTARETPCCSARGRTTLATSASSDTTLQRRISIASLPASIFDKSRMSLISVSRCSPLRRITAA